MTVMLTHGCAVPIAVLVILACLPWAMGPSAGCMASKSFGELSICSKVSAIYDWRTDSKVCYIICTYKGNIRPQDLHPFNGLLNLGLACKNISN